MNMKDLPAILGSNINRSWKDLKDVPPPPCYISKFDESMKVICRKCGKEFETTWGVKAAIALCDECSVKILKGYEEEEGDVR